MGYNTRKQDGDKGIDYQNKSIYPKNKI